MTRAKKAEILANKAQIEKEINEIIENTSDNDEANELVRTPVAVEESALDNLSTRVHLLEKKAVIACQICSEICPQKAVARVEKLDTESKGFTIKQSITVAGAREIQRVYGQIVALALGHEASLLYKV